MSLPKVRIGGYGVTRLVLGSNPFLGFSHFSQARSRWLRGYFTVDRVVEVSHGLGIATKVCRLTPLSVVKG